jgi:flagellar motor switch protein FliN/FliY
MSGGGDKFGDDKFKESEGPATTVQPVAFGPLSSPAPSGGVPRNLDMLMDLEVPVAVEIGRAMVSLDQVVKLVPGSIVPLDKRAEEPVDLRVNGKLIARGEVVLVDDVYGMRITQIVDAAGRIASLK